MPKTLSDGSTCGIDGTKQYVKVFGGPNDAFPLVATFVCGKLLFTE